MLLAIDYGDRYIGLAATDVEGKISYRYGTIDQKQRNALQAIAAIVAKEHVTCVLVGIPRNLQGEETEQTRKTQAFASRLRKKLDLSVEIVEVDETLTSIAAQQVLQYEGGTKEAEHSEAARLLLVEYLTHQKRQSL